MKRLNTTKVWVTLVVILLIAAGTFFLINSSIRKGQKSLYETYTYGGPGGDYIFTIVPDSDGLSVRHFITVRAGNSEYNYPLRYGPRELEDIPMGGDVKESLLFNGNAQKTRLYITQDPDLPDKTDTFSALAVIDINQVTGTSTYGAFKIPTFTAVTRETNATIKNNLPLVTCDKSSNSVGVIEIRLGSQNKITQEPNGCVILEGIDGQGIMKVSDKLILNMLGVF